MDDAIIESIAEYLDGEGILAEGFDGHDVAQQLLQHLEDQGIGLVITGTDEEM